MDSFIWGNSMFTLIDITKILENRRRGRGRCINVEASLGSEVSRLLIDNDALYYWWNHAFTWCETSVFTQIEVLKLKGIL